MKSYIVIQSNKTGNWLVKDKKYLTTCAKAQTREEAYKKIAELKAEDKRQTQLKKEKEAKAKASIENLIIGYTEEQGKTKSGKTYILISNCGLEERSRYCYTLTIDGECIFTSGTLERAAQCIAKR